MPVKRESTIEAELVTRVLLRGGICVKMTVVGQRGFFDRLVILPGPRIAFVELKRPKGGRVSPHQKLWHERLKSLGVVVALLKNSADIDRLLSATPQNDKGRSA